MGKYKDDLDIEIDEKHQRKTWIVERISWVLFLLFILAGFTGFFGRGGVSKKTIGSEKEGMKIEYEKFLRYHTSDQMRITVYRSIQNKMLRLWVSDKFTEKVVINTINPAPEKVEFDKNGAIYYFNVGDGNAPKIVNIYFKPEHNGNMEVSIADKEGASLSFSQFIFP